MQLVFVHGVNVRKGELYEKEVEFRNRNFADIFFRQLGHEVPDESIANPYWGDLGADISSDQPFLPRGSYWTTPRAMGKALQAARLHTAPAQKGRAAAEQASSPLHWSPQSLSCP